GRETCQNKKGCRRSPTCAARRQHAHRARCLGSPPSRKAVGRRGRDFITELQESETVQNKVTLSHEEAQVEWLDSAGNVMSAVEEAGEHPTQPRGPASILQGRGARRAASTRR